MTKELLSIGNSSANYHQHLKMSSLSHSVFFRFYLYKLPKEDRMEPHHQGDRYLLLEKGSEEWSNGKGTVNDTTGALGKTVGQLYSQGKVCLSLCRSVSLSVCLPVSFFTTVTSSVLRANMILRSEKLRTEIYFTDVGTFMCWFSKKI